MTTAPALELSQEAAQELRQLRASVQALRLVRDLRTFCATWQDYSRQRPELRRLLCQLVQDAGELENFAGEIGGNGVQCPAG